MNILLSTYLNYREEFASKQLQRRIETGHWFGNSISLWGSFNAFRHRVKENITVIDLTEINDRRLSRLRGRHYSFGTAVRSMARVKIHVTFTSYCVALKCPQSWTSPFQYVQNMIAHCSLIDCAPCQTSTASISRAVGRVATRVQNRNNV